MTTGETIRKKREELGLTQVDVAKRLGINKSYINRMEHDDCKIPLKRISELATVFGCSPAELIGEMPGGEGTIVELEIVAKQLDAKSIGALIQYAKFLAREKDE